MNYTHARMAQCMCLRRFCTGLLCLEPWQREREGVGDWGDRASLGDYLLNANATREVLNARNMRATGIYIIHKRDGVRHDAQSSCGGTANNVSV